MADSPPKKRPGILTTDKVSRVSIIPRGIGALGFTQLNVIPSASRGLLEHQLLSDTAAQQHIEPVQQLSALHQVPVFGRKLFLREARRSQPISAIASTGALA